MRKVHYSDTRFYTKIITRQIKNERCAMTNERQISQKKLGTLYLILTVVLVIAGVIIRIAFSPKTVYDLHILVLFTSCVTFVIGLQKSFFKKNGIASFSNEKISSFLTGNAIVLMLIVLYVVILFIEPRFLQVRAMLDILSISAPKLIVALGMFFVMMTAGIDLSAGRMVLMSATVSASMLQTADYSHRFWPNLPQLPLFLPILITLTVCVIFGMLSGILVARFHVYPFIATLAVQVIVYGATSLYSDTESNKSQPIGGVRPDFVAIGQSRLFAVKSNGGEDIFPGISVLVPIALVICFILWFVLNKTVFGINIRNIGINRKAAKVSGINIFAVTMLVYMLSALTSGTAGVLEYARTAGPTANYGLAYELDAIAACLIGGASLNGGAGKISGVIRGVLVFTVISYGLVFINVSPMWQQVIKGVIIAAAAVDDMSKQNRKNHVLNTANVI